MSGETAHARYIVAITEGRDHDIGIAALDRNTATLTLTQISDCATYIKSLHHLHLHTPGLVLIPDNYPLNKNASTSTSRTILIRSLQSEFQNTFFEHVPRRYWNSQLGSERITKLCVGSEDRTAILVVTRDKYYALCSAAALFEYLENDMNILLADNSLRLLYTTAEGCLFIDMETAKSLELIETTRKKRTSRKTLFQILNYTFTDMGSRLLRNNLLAPSKVQATIDARLDAVDELVHNEDMYNSVRESLKLLHKADLDKLLSSLVTSQFGGISTSRVSCFSTRVAQMLKIRDFLCCLPAIQLAISTSSSSLIRLLYKILNDERFDALQNMVSQTFNEDLPLYKKSNKASLHIYVYAVKASINRLLDVARETFRENISDIYQLCQDVSEKYELQIQLNHNMTGNYCFMVKSGTLPCPLPKEFIHVAGTKGNKVSFSTLELRKKNARIKDALDEIMILSDQIVERLLHEIIEDIGSLYKASEGIALLDLLWSFAHASIVHRYVRPEFTGVIAVKGGRHPILDADPTFKAVLVPNDIYCCTSTYFQLIQGANMSGKTTYIKQIALLVILAMCGCFVPAEYASFRLHDALFARFAGEDSIVDCSLSTFGSEMASTAAILGLVTAQSIVFLDEIGRGTSVSEGLGISLAVAERLLLKKCFVLFITHFEGFSRLLGGEPAVISLHLITHWPKQNMSSGFLFKYKVVDGTSQRLGHYGIGLASLADIPHSMFGYAVQASERISLINEEQEQKSGVRRIVDRRKALIQTRSRLQRIAKFSTLTQKDLLVFLQKTQAEVIVAFETQV